MRRFSKFLTVSAAVLLLLLGAGAYALASSASQTITVCVSHHGGTLYRASSCARGDSKVSWNRQGRRGLTGPRGATGPRGRAGLKGSPGLPGSARAYASVRAGTHPSLDPSRTKGFTAVSIPDGNSGYYCLTLSPGIAAAKVAPIVSVAWNSGYAGELEFALPVDSEQVSGTFACTGNAIEVITLGGGPPSTPTPALDFTVAVP